MGKRDRCLGIILSTQAEDDEHALSQLIDDGISGIDTSLVVDLTAAPADADVFDRDVIRQVNPALGVFLDAETIFKEAEQAERLPSAESAFRNLRCNQRIAAAADMLCTPAVWNQGDQAIDDSIFRDGRPRPSPSASLPIGRRARHRGQLALKQKLSVCDPCREHESGESYYWSLLPHPVPHTVKLHARSNQKAWRYRP